MGKRHCAVETGNRLKFHSFCWTSLFAEFRLHCTKWITNDCYRFWKPRWV